MRRAAILATILLISVTSVAQPPKSPEEFLGHEVGADRRLAPWPKVVDYHRRLASASPRVSLESAGTTTLGRDMPVVVITSEANQARLEELRRIARALAHPQRLTPPEEEALVDLGRAIVLVTCSIHSSEVGCTQMSMELAWRLATADDPEVEGWLDEVILLLVPSINPDGQIMVVDWYERWLGTEHEGGRMPWLYHHYTGHDNNRDFFMLTQAETRAVNRLLYHRWFPQVYLDEHQMGGDGPRMFVPPQTDPLDPEVHPLVFRQADLLGTAMALRLEEAGHTGVGSNMIFDSYWPGGTRNTAWWKNVVGLLTEVASVRRATPVFVDPNELEGGGKGFPEYGRRANFPSPWPGGWWRLRDIVDYELVATMALLETVAAHREDVLRNFWRMGREAVDAGRSEPPFAFLVPPEQHDPVAAGLLVELLLEHGVDVEVAQSGFEVGRRLYPAGTYVVPADQPYRAFLLTMLRPQRYPEVRPHRDGPVLPPYDATTWSLPVALGVRVEEAEEPVQVLGEPVVELPWPGGVVVPGEVGTVIARAADSAPRAVNRLLAEGVEVLVLRGAVGSHRAGDFLVPAGGAARERLGRLAEELRLVLTPLEPRPEISTLRVRAPRVGLYKPWLASMDEGWTRFLLDRYEFAHQSLDTTALRDGTYAGAVDVMVLPDIGPTWIRDGEPDSERARRWYEPLPPEYAGGIGEEGGEKLAGWVRGGGTVVALNRSSGYVLELLDLPVRNVLDDVDEADFRCPGAALRILVDTGHPLGFGMRPEEAAYFDDSPAFATEIPDARFERTVVARYPEDRRDVLVSGYLKGAERLERRAAVVEVRVGEGRVVLIGFKPQQRAQTHATFKLLFNALYLPMLEEVVESP